jgi:DNA polymerase sigma
MVMANAQPVHMGIKCCYFIKQKLIEYPQLEPLTFLLKKFLALRDLNAPFLGGLSSYGLILLIIAFINQDNYLTYDPEGHLSPARIFA